MKTINKYIGTYRVFQEIDLTTKKPSSNSDDTYLKGKYNTQIYRWDKNKLCIYFPSGRSATNIILPLFKEAEIKYKLHINCDTECVYMVSESDIDKIHSILKFNTKGKNIQAKSKRTAAKLAKEKEKLKEKKLKEKAKQKV